MDVDVPGDGGSNRRVANHNYFLRRGQENYYLGWEAKAKEFFGGGEEDTNLGDSCLRFMHTTE